MSYKYNTNKRKVYDPRTYTDFGSIKPTEKTEVEKRMEADKIYRKTVIKTIESKIGKAKLEDIVREIAKSPMIKKHFEYLIRHGINLESTFIDWYNAYVSSKERGNPFEGMEQGWKI